MEKVEWFFRDESRAGAVDYGLLLALVHSGR